MSKTRASKVRNELKKELGRDISYPQIAEMCSQLNISFKSHEKMGIHYNSVLEENDANRLSKAFREKGGGPSRKNTENKATEAPKSAASTERTQPSSSEEKETTPQNRVKQSIAAARRSGQSYDGRPSSRRAGSSYVPNANANAAQQGGDALGPAYKPRSGASAANKSIDTRPPRSTETRYRRPEQPAQPRYKNTNTYTPRNNSTYTPRPPAEGGNPNTPGAIRPPRSTQTQYRRREDTAPRPGGSRPPGGAPRPGGYRPGGSSSGGPGGRPPGRRPAGAAAGGAFVPPIIDTEPVVPRPEGRRDRAPARKGQQTYNQHSRGNDGPRGGRPARPNNFTPGTGRRRKSSRKYKLEKMLQQQEKMQQEQRELTPEEKIIELTAQKLTVAELADKMKITSSEVIKALFMKGMASTINQVLDIETAEMVAQSLEYEVLMPTEKEIKEAEEKPAIPVVKKVQINNEGEDPDKLKSRPPVVTIMGHVDHGKTSLLDYIRTARVTAGEAGGITQHIGAYVVDVNEHQIAFLDTPGHEAFTAMRARGASVTDIAIIVIAADDGIMPQTIEAINHAKASNVQIIIAVNKIDKEGANIERSKQQLTEHGLVPEEWGGDTVIVPLSAKTGEGVDDLLDMIILVSDIQDLKANPDKEAAGVVIEAKLEKGRGSVGTVLVQAGTLKQGDAFVVGSVYGRVRAMTNEKGERMKSAGPSTPVEIIGFQEVPEAGEIFQVVKNDKLAKSIAEANRLKREEEALNKGRVNLSSLYDTVEDGKVKELKVVVKADVQGTVDAIKQSLERLSNDKVLLQVIHGGPGEISESDVMLASASDALVVGFNVKADNNAKRVAQEEQIEIRFYDIIYKLIEDVESAMEGMLEPEMVEVELGVAEVRAIFKTSKAGTIAGCYVLEGKCERNASVRVTRKDEVIFTGAVSSLKRFKDDVKEVNAGYECGISVKDFNDLEESDKLVFFKIKARHEIEKA
jgi:translation initiation factor IF-2